MMNQKVSKAVAKGVKEVLNLVLREEANTASCIFMYQPKAPNELKNYRRTK